LDRRVRGNRGPREPKRARHRERPGAVSRRSDELASRDRNSRPAGLKSRLAVVHVFLPSLGKQRLFRSAFLSPPVGPTLGRLHVRCRSPFLSVAALNVYSLRRRRRATPEDYCRLWSSPRLRVNGEAPL